jgi:hypothetical protein
MIDLKTLDLQQLNLVLHNMRIYGISKDKQEKVINEINNRENNNASNK